MIISGGTVFIRQSNQLPQLTLRDARVVMEVAEPAGMDDFGAFLSNRLAPGSRVTGCTFLTLETWARSETCERLNVVKADARNDRSAGWSRRLWERLTTR